MNNQNLNSEQDIINALSLSFQSFPEKQKKIFRIKFNGKLVRTLSGKTVWPSLGAAKNALKNHCTYNQFNLLNKNLHSNIISSLALLHTGDIYHKDRNKIYKEFINNLIKSKILEFVEIKE